MAAAVMRPLGAGDSMRKENRGAANEWIKPNDRLTSSDRLEIYNQQYWWRLLGSFADDFPGLRAVLGERKFDKLAVSYLTDHGSMSWSLRDLGGGLEAHLIAHPELIAPHHQLALEMTRVEWARIVAFDGEQKPLLDAEKFVRRKPEKMTLGVQPYVALLELSYPIDHLLRRLKRSENAPASNAMSGGVKERKFRLAAKPLPGPIYLAIHRLELSVYYKRLDRETFLLLSALRDGHALEPACELAFAESVDAPEIISEKVRTWFAAWMGFGWLCERGRNA